MKSPVVILLLCSLVAFAGFLYRLTGMVWGTAPREVVQGEAWSAGHLALILMAMMLVGFFWVLPLSLQQLLDTASGMLVSR